MTKKLVIIHGVTGAIGSACLALFASQKNTIVYGISRKAKDFREFFIDGKLPEKTLICSILSETYVPRMSHYFAEAINTKEFDEIYYIHTIGIFPFEVDNSGNRTVSYDNNADGIDDRCVDATDLFLSFNSSLSAIRTIPCRSFIFGSICDIYQPLVHTSFWKTMNNLREEIKHRHKNGLPGNVSIINISSVLCPHELMTRPYVFTHTDSNPQYWLRPYEVANFVAKLIAKGQTKKLKEYSLFRKLPNFDPEYYTDEKFTPRKVKELFGKLK